MRGLLGPADTALGRQNRIIWAGMAAALLNQYVWLLPIPYATVVCAVVATGCAVVVLLWKVAEWTRPRLHL